MLEFAVILPAAGASVRFGSGRNKLFEMLDGVPVIVRSIRAFAGRTDCRKIVIATSDCDALRTILTNHLKDCAIEIGQRICICPGGENRAASVRHGLERVDPQINWVAVHDAARPLVSGDLIDRVLRFASDHGAAAAPALAVSQTIKQAQGPLPARVERTIPRQGLWAMQTPQVMPRHDLARAFDQCSVPLEQITDDVQLLELSGRPVWLVDGDEQNIKITTTRDLQLAHALLAGRGSP